VTAPLFELWVYLAATPLAGLTLTLVAYAAGWWIYARARFHPLANPVPIAVAMIVAALAVTRTEYRTYFDGAQFVHFLLGPATVALAVPMVREWPRVRRLARPIAAALAAGSAAAVVTAVGLAWALGASPATLLSIAPKSVTAPIAMGIAQQIGGVPALAAVFAVITGVLGAVAGKFVLDRLRIRDWPARGFALGLAAHGIGTARAFQVNAEAGAFAGLAFALHGLVAAVLFPLALVLLRSLG
jgi:predicted murein hydrolase (TIGR00659 family)